MYIIYVRNVWICKEIEYPGPCKFNGKLCTLNAQNVQICREIEYQNCVNSTGNCVLLMYGMSEFAKKLNIWNCVNSTESCVHYLYRNVRFCGEIEYPFLNSAANCVQYMYFLDFLSYWIYRSALIQREIAYIICTNCFDLERNWISKSA